MIRVEALVVQKLQPVAVSELNQLNAGGIQGLIPGQSMSNVVVLEISSWFSVATYAHPRKLHNYLASQPSRELCPFTKLITSISSFI